MITFAKSDHDYKLSKEETETLDKIKATLQKGDSNVLDSIVQQLDLPMVRLSSTDFMLLFMTLIKIKI